MTKSIDAPALREILLGHLEYALVDVREQGLFGRNHILLAVNIPLSRFELDFRRLIPRPGTRVILCDEGDGIAERAAALLDAAGYPNLAILAGGVGAWAAAGYELFSGINVPSKLFGEHVEHHFGTPSITVEQCKALIEEQADMVILDTRPLAEYSNVTIPTAIDAPGAELVYRVRDLAPDPETLVVVNCGGRTRSIIGAQALINAGVPNKVVDLMNGTMGWHLAGFELEKGAGRQCGPVSEEALAWAKQASDTVAKRFGVRTINRAELDAWRAESSRHSLYLLDVRFPAEYEAGHLPGSYSAPGGQLVQATDEYIGTRNARVVLIDDNGVRATITASWLVQMGWPEVAVLAGGLDGDDLVTGRDAPDAITSNGVSIRTVGVDELRDLLAEGRATVVDFANSTSHRKGHIPGACWAIRSRLDRVAEKLPGSSILVVTAPEDGLARLAARDLGEVTGAEVRWLPGGTAAWIAAGQESESGFDNALDEPVDRYHRPFEHPARAEEAMKQYLEWEINLIEQIKRDGTLSFPHFNA